MDTNITDIDVICPRRGEEKWWVYLVAFVVIYLTGLIITSNTYGVYFLLFKKYKLIRPSIKGAHFFKIFRGYVRQLISGDTIPSKILISITLVCNLVYMGVAIHRSFLPHRVEECFTLIEDIERIVELAVVFELIIFTLLRFLATNNIVLFWLNGYTIVDVITLSHIFIYLALGVDWIGLRGLRFIYLTQIITVLQFTPLLRSQDMADLLSLAIYFITLWLTSAGIIHLLETQGDPWKDFDNRVPHTVLVYAYYMMVTMSTVGYGDINPETDLGRGFMTFFIIGGLAFFAAILPKLAEVTSTYYNKTQYAKFDTTRVPRHVIVCGHVTAISARDFLKDFLHPDRGDKNTHILFLHPEKPDQDLKNILHSHYTRVQFIHGSVMDSDDLQKAKLMRSEAIFILADKNATNPTEEDNSNLLRVVSVKNTTYDIPVIVQLLHSFSKKQIQNIEGWKVGRDIAVCLNELKLGLLAQSCLCPGFSTLIANLFYTSNSSLGSGEMNWQDNYIKGASNEIYSSTFSPDFNGMTFHEAAKVCYNELNLVLLAIDHITQTECRYYVNPSPKRFPPFKINFKSMMGYFIAQDIDHASTASTFCNCDSPDKHNAQPEDEVVQRRLSDARRKGSIIQEEDLISNPLSKMLSDMLSATKGNETETVIIEFDDEDIPEDNILELDVGTDLDTHNDGKKENGSNMYPVSHEFLRDATESPQNLHLDYDSELSDFEASEEKKLHLYAYEPNELELAILNNPVTCKNGDRLRPQVNMRNHVVLCIFADDRSPLLGLHNFLKPLRRKDLPPESIKPVVIISNKAFIEKEWPIIRSIPKVYIVVGSPLRWQNLSAARVTKSSVCIVLTMLTSTSGHEQAIQDKEAILCSLSIKKRLKKYTDRVIPVITDLRLDSNVQFLDFSDEDQPDKRICLAQPFACGEAFSVSMFDSFTTAVFHSPATLYLIQDLIHASGTRSFCQVFLEPAKFSGRLFKDFYSYQLDNHNVCLGIFRKLPQSDSNQRYIITCPDQDMILRDDDLAFLLTE